MVKVNRLPPKERRALILDAAVKVAQEQGFENLTRERIAEEAGVHHTLVHHYLGKMKKVRTRVMRAAVQREVLEIIAYGVYSKHPQALKAPLPLRLRALELMGGE